jgi:formate dehydrogenase subunit gamma
MSVVLKSGDVPRYNGNERVTHWIVALLFILLAASGLALFHPAFWFLTSLLGGGTWARILHPMLGITMFVFFAVMAARYWRDNMIQSYDHEWQKRLSDVINNRDQNMPEIDKYNMGQKQLFWTMVVTMVVLLLTGIVLWRDTIYQFPVLVVRISAVLHALSAFVLILGVVVHVYAGIYWVKGSLRAMTRGTVTHAWAKHHHARWYRRVTGNK